MHFLLTNDDGIGAVGLQALSAAAREDGHAITVCAPLTQQSATSQHITLASPLIVRPVSWEGGMPAYAIEGTPADCVRLSPLLASQPIDFVFSGINNGENAGSAIYYSGTVCAAREARMLHMPSMAVSIMKGADDAMRLRLARLAVRIAKRFSRAKLPRMCLLNLNAPALPPEKLKPLRVAPISDAYYLDSYERRVSPYGTTYFWLEAEAKIEPHRPGTDMALLGEGHITLTCLSGLGDENAAISQIMQDFT